MSGFKDVMKNGWHPERSGTTIRGSVSGLLGRNRDHRPSDAPPHAARPLSDLRDASSFAPPPRRAGPGVAPAPPPPDRGVNPSPGADPPPPPRPHSEAATTSTPHAPRLPPRLPPRGPRATSSPAGDGDEKGGWCPNGASAGGLGNAGVSVPALGIGRAAAAESTPPSPPSRATTARPSAGAGKWNPPVDDELRGRFARLGRTPPAPENPSAGGGTTWAQKRAALATASSFHKDPASVSLSDARAAASTANNFRERHGEQVAAGVRKANGLNQKYGLVDRLGACSGGAQQAGHAPLSGVPSPPPPNQASAEPSAFGKSFGTSAAALLDVAGRKKPPPPPPPKKRAGLVAAHGDGPPPVATSTRPAF